MTKANHQDLLVSTSLLGLIVGTYVIQTFVWPPIVTFGLVPRTIMGLRGILTMPFLHASFRHLAANLGALVVLLGFLFAFHPRRTGVVVFRVILIGGILLWLFGRSANHVGASGLIYGLAAYLIVSGIVERRLLHVVAAVGVAVMYGSSLFWGLIPVDPMTSWDGHLAGSLAGIFLAHSSRGSRSKKTGRRRQPSS